MYARVLSFYISRTKMRSLFVTLQNTRHLQASRVIVESHLHLVLSLWSLDILGNNRSPLMLYSIIIVIFWNFQQWKTSHHVIELELYNNLSMRAVTKTPLWHMTRLYKHRTLQYSNFYFHCFYQMSNTQITLEVNSK